MKLSKSTASIAVLHLFVLLVSDAAINLKMLRDPRSIRLKQNIFQQRHTSAESCPPIDVAMLESQNLLKATGNEDRCLMQHFFAGMCGGQYLDIGAHDGVQDSISHVFYASPELHWHGVNIELDPDNFDQLAKNRRYDLANIHAAVCSDQATVHYAHQQHSKTYGGIWEFTTETYRQQWWPNMTMFEAIPMQCTPLQRIIDQSVKCDNMHFDLMSLNLNGAEYSSLLGLNFEKVTFGVIVVRKNENDDVNRRVDELLRSKGYDRVNDIACDVGDSKVWYVDSDFNRLYNDLIVQHQNHHLRGS